MKKEKVFIVVSHVNSPKAGSHPGRAVNPKIDWEVSEKVEFVDQLRNKHLTMATAVGDYINRKMITGSRFGLNDYEQFEEYIRSKYASQMKQLDAAYREHIVIPEIKDSPEVFVDNFGNVRTRTVFDV